MNEKKKEFITALCNTLKMDGRSGVESIEYGTDVWFEDVLYEEVIQINFRGGEFKLINVTANSNGENAMGIIKAVYGGEAVGLLFYGFEEKEDEA